MGTIRRTKRKIERKVKDYKNRGERKLTEANRASGQKLKGELIKAERGLGGVKEPETRRVFQNVTRIMQQLIESAPVIGQYDVSEMDKAIMKMITVYADALTNGDVETAKRGYERIHQALVECRRELTVEDLDHKDSILDERIERLDKFQTVLEMSKKANTNRLNANRKEKEYKNLEKDYLELYEKVEKEVAEHPGLYEELADLRPGIDPVPMEAKELDTDLKNLKRMSERVDDLKSAIGNFEDLYNTQKSALEAMETELSVQKGLLSRQEEEQLEKSIQDFIQQLQDAQLEAQKLDKLQEERHVAVMELDRSLEKGMASMRGVKKYEEIRNRMKQMQEDEARGMENMQQEMQEENNRILNTN